MNASSPVTPELPKVLQDITDERVRQIGKGYTTEHDDQHHPGDMVLVARGYAFAAFQSPVDATPVVPNRQLLVKATALMVAAIERMDRDV